MTRSILHIDIETRSPVDLVKRNADVYARHPNTRIILVSWALDGGEVFTADTSATGNCPESLRQLLEDSSVVKAAWNAPFEMLLITHVWNIECPPDDWLCVMSLAQSLSLPASLAAAGAALNLSSDTAKDLAGKRLIRLFSVVKDVPPTPPLDGLMADHPDDWTDYKRYNAQDVIAEREIYQRIKIHLHHTVNATERALWKLDREINQTGLPIDRKLATVAATLCDHLRDDALTEMSVITGLDNPNSATQLKAWLASAGRPFESLARPIVDAALRDPALPSTVRRVLELRLLSSQTALKKYDALLALSGADGRLRETFRWFGASRTGRWAGRGFQPQNVPALDLVNSDDIADKQAALNEAAELVVKRDVLALNNRYGSLAPPLRACLRGAIAARDGYRLVVADLSSIESVVVGWLANCRRILDLFRDGRDAYRDYASIVFRKPADQITSAERKFAKPPVLGCNYGMGADGLAQYAQNFGVDFCDMWTPEINREYLLATLDGEDGGDAGSDDTRRRVVAKKLVNTYRATYPEIPELWWSYERAFICAARQRGREFRVGRVTFFRDGEFVFIRLPSGRCLAYLDAEATGEGRDTQISYSGVDTFSRKWGRVDTWGGKLVENVTQAVARDVLCVGLLNADLLGFQIVGHVHDEIICEQPSGDTLGTEQLEKAMTVLPIWADGMPVSAVGWSGKRYCKA